VFTNWLSWYQEITYLDADTFFFSDPEHVFNEIGAKSIAIVPHRFPPHRKFMEQNGRFNVSWVSFKGPIGLTCLQRWADQCREWCFNKYEDGKFGDQKYLDSWPDAYPGEVCEIENMGVGTAPWNLNQYSLTGNDKNIFLCSAAVDDGLGLVSRLVFYHYHEYLHNKRLTNYKLRDEDRELIYAPYIAAVEAAKQRVDAIKVTV